MKLPRRTFLHLAAGAVALPTVSRVAQAQAYPSRPVRLIVPFAPGGVNDIAARLVSQSLSERLGQQFLIENRPGGGGNIGIEAVVRAPADGYTLLVVGTTAAINATLFDKLNYNFIRDIAPVASIVRVTHVMQVNPSFPAVTVSEFIAYAKANPGKISMGSGGNGSPAHVIGELFKMMAGVNLVHVPYRGGAPALTNLLGGQPRNTPSEIVGKLNTEINVGLADPKLKARFADLGGTVLPNSSAAFGKLIADDTEKWGKVIKFSGSKPD